MPFKSKEQERYLQINEPEIYRDWVEKYGHFKGAESFGAESCDDLCTQCEWCDTCIEGVCENVEEEWGREWADYDHLCRECHDKHIEEMQSANAESFASEMSHSDKSLILWEMVQQNLNYPPAVEGFYATFFGVDKEYYDGMDLVVLEAVKDFSKNPEWTDEMFKEYGLDDAESFRSYKVAPDLSSYTKAELVSSIAGPQGTAAYDEVVYDPIAQSRLSAESIDSFSPARLIILGASIGVALGLYNTRGE